MNRHARTVALAVGLLLTCLVGTACTDTIKEPAVAGSFYPAGEKDLRETVEAFLSNARTSPPAGDLIALVSPHAGYRYSGQVAAYGYTHLRNRDIRKVILIGQSHHEAFRGASVFTTGSFKTPLGAVEIDEKAATALRGSLFR